MLALVLPVTLSLANLGFCQDTPQDYYKAWNERFAHSRNWQRPNSYEEYKADLGNCEDYGVYDYIIVGGAASAPVLANRLSEVEDTRVLLLVPGDNLNQDTPDVDLLPGAKYYQEVSSSNYGYRTERQTSACLQQQDEKCTLDLGKRGRPDDIYYIRGNKADYDGWGLPLWSYHKTLPFFKAAERVLIPQLHNRGKHGTLPVEHADVSELLQHVLSAHEELGYTLGDYNGDSYHVSRMQVHVRHGVKQTAHQVYLNPIIDQRSNLKVLQGAFPVRIGIDHHGVVTKVTFTHRGRCFNGFPQKELIVAADAIITPHLLMKSGIGPRKELEKCHITIRKELPVGYNLLDYPTYEIQFRTNFCTPYFRLSDDFVNYATKRSGRFAAPYAQVVAFCNDSLPSFMASYSSPRSYDDFKVLKTYYNYKDSMDNFLYSLRPNDILAKLTFFSCEHPGRIRLRSCDPFDHPVIDLKYEYDDRSRKGYDQVLKLVRTKAFGRLKATPGPNFVRECRNTSSKLVKKCLLKHLMRANGDPIGTCQMGIGDSAVVDQKLLVLGVHKLRIVDASVIPGGFRGSTASFLVMAGEYIAHMIKQKNVIK